MLKTAEKNPKKSAQNSPKKQNFEIQLPPPAQKKTQKLSISYQ